jgi:hypothetical protein
LQVLHFLAMLFCGFLYHFFWLLLFSFEVADLSREVERSEAYLCIMMIFFRSSHR